MVARHSDKADKASGAPMSPHAFTPDQVPYGPGPDSVPPGAELAVLEGDPSAQSGDYTVRAKMPDGYVIAPHWHPKRENVTVVSGTLKFGMGDNFDEASMKPFPTGSFAYLEPSMHHYVKAQGETVVQIHGQSPMAFNYVNASDDPRNKKQ
jgi:hypothetical protein